MEHLKGRKVHTLQMAIGCDLIGSKMSMSHKESDMTITSIGILSVSKKSKRQMLIPYTNIKGFELMPPKHDENAPDVPTEPGEFMVLGKPVPKKK